MNRGVSGQSACSVAEETIAALDRLFPEKLGQAPDNDTEQVPESEDDRTWHPLPAKTDGYIQDVNHAALLRLAQHSKAAVRMERGIGEFVVQGTPLASLAREDPPDRETIAALNASYNVSSHRTVDQDPAFARSNDFFII